MSEAKQSDLTDLLFGDFSDAETAMQIYPIVSCVKSAFADGKYSDVDEFISSVDVMTMSVCARLCLVRSTSCAKNKLKHWDELLDRVAKTLSEPERELCGLYAK